MPVRLLILGIAISLSPLLNMLNSTIVNVSLSNIAGDFGVGQSQSTWTITSYSVTEAIMLPLAGWLTSRLGIVKQFVLSNILFAVASFLCAISFNFPMMLGARLFQGIVGASMVPLSQVLITRLFPDNKRTAAMTIWSMTLVLGPVLGPVVGGWITDTYSWRYSFHLSAAIGVIISIIAYAIFKEDLKKEKPQKEPVDYIGLSLLIICVGSFQIMLDKGTDLDWFSSNFIVSLGITAFISVVLLIIWEWYHKYPVVDIKVFKIYNFSLGCIVMLLGYIGFYFASVMLPMWLKSDMGYTSFDSGNATFTLGIPIMILSPFAGYLLSKYQSKYVTAIGLLLYGSLTIITARMVYLDSPKYVIQIVRASQGIGLAFFFVSINTFTIGNLDQKTLLAAAGIYNFMRTISGSIGTSLVSPLWNHTTAFHQEMLTSNIHSGNPNWNSVIKSFNGDVPLTVLKNIETLTYRMAHVMGVVDVLTVAGVMGLIAIPLILTGKKS